MEAFFLKGRHGRLLCVYHPPTQSRVLGSVLLFPPFAEELNRCRRMIALQARALASIGVGALILDLTGTGDSSENLSEATWEGWLDDMQMGLDWLQTHRVPLLGFWAIRAGALLASSFIARSSYNCHRMILWKPVLDGAAYINQLLRIRVAGSASRGEIVETTEGLRSRISKGEEIEIGGYSFSSSLFIELGLQQFVAPDRCFVDKVDWFEVVSKEGPRVPTPSSGVAYAWKQKGVDVTVDLVVGPPFWSSQSDLELSSLVRVTTTRFAGGIHGS